MLGNLSHIAFVVRDLDAAVAKFEAVLGARLLEREVLAAAQAEVALLEVGGVQFELLSSPAPDSRIGRILAEKGEGIHHVSFNVNGIEREMGEARAAGVRLLDAAPRTGAHGRRIAFFDPAETCGIQFEMVEEPPSHRKD